MCLLLHSVTVEQFVLLDFTLVMASYLPGEESYKLKYRNLNTHILLSWFQTSESPQWFIHVWCCAHWGYFHCLEGQSSNQSFADKMKNGNFIFLHFQLATLLQSLNWWSETKWQFRLSIRPIHTACKLNGRWKTPNLVLRLTNRGSFLHFKLC